MKQQLKVFSIPVFYLKEGKYFVAYTPAFKLSTCGKTFKQAQKRFSEAVTIFLEEIEKKGTLKDVLLECGWTKSHKKLSPPAVISSTSQEIRIPMSA